MAPFDPYTQTFTLTRGDATTKVPVSVAEVDSIYYTSVKTCLLYGAEMGASLVMLVVVGVLTKPAKRRSPVYLLNLASLLLSFLRSLLIALFYTGAWVEFYAVAANDFGRVPRSAYATSVAGNVVPLLLTTSVLASLVLQAHTVCKIFEWRVRRAVAALSCLVFLLGVGFRFAQTVEDSRAVMTAESFYYLEWIHTGALVMGTISIWYFSIIFTSKLLYTLWTRKRNGWKQWSAVRILAAMGGCTMIIPSIFAILEYTSFDSFPKAGTLTLTTVALLLPLSSLWAGTATDHEQASGNIFAGSGPLGGGGGAGGYGNHAGAGSSRKPCLALLTTAPGSARKYSSTSLGPLSSSSFSAAGGEYELERKAPAQAHMPPSSIGTVIEGGERARSASRDSTELDLEALGVRVDRSYGVRKGSLL